MVLINTKSPALTKCYQPQAGGQAAISLAWALFKLFTKCYKIISNNMSGSFPMKSELHMMNFMCDFNTVYNRHTGVNK